MKIRLYTVAKELEMDWQKVFAICNQLGIQVKPSMLASIEPQTRERILEFVRRRDAKKPRITLKPRPILSIHRDVPPPVTRLRRRRRWQFKKNPLVTCQNCNAPLNERFVICATCRASNSDTWEAAVRLERWSEFFQILRGYAAGYILSELRESKSGSMYLTFERRRRKTIRLRVSDHKHPLSNSDLDEDFVLPMVAPNQRVEINERLSDCFARSLKLNTKILEPID